MISTIIFDMNGVIVDDEALHEEAFRRVCERLGIDFSREMYRELCMGRTDAEGFHAIASAFGVAMPDTESLVREKETIYFGLAAREIRAYPGIADIIRALQNEFRLALVSSAGARDVRMVLETFGLEGLFETIITGGDVARGKPDPEPYLAAASRMGVPPAECCAVEDSPSGVRSAKAAGMRCLAVATTHAPELLREADAVAEDVSGILEKIRQMSDDQR